MLRSSLAREDLRVRLSLFDVRPEERRTTALAFLVYFGMLAAHTTLETARDALFLSRLPASRLPWAYLAMAAIALWVSQGWAGRRLSASRALPTMLFVAGVGTALFWVVGVSQSPLGLNLLYVWTGIMATLTALQFWLLLAEIYTIAQAKRVFGLIAAGSLLGAVAGGAIASVMSSRFDTRDLLIAAAVLYATTGLGPARWLRPPPRSARSQAVSEPIGLADGWTLLRREPYIGRLIALVLISTMAVTLADYVFKSAVSHRVPAAQLGSFFATFYTVLNVVALFSQIVVAGWLLRTVGLHRALWTLPAMLFFAAAAVALGGGLFAALILKGADGALRPLNRTGIEMLFLPIPDRLRARAKPFSDVLAGRGGQALASIFILGEIAQHRGETMLAVVAAGLCILWVGWAAELRPHYFNLFRAALREGTLEEDPNVPQLDLGSLELLFAALNGQQDAEVLGALDLLNEQGRIRLVPALILYHPSRAVVLHALALFERSGRTDVIPVVDRLLHHQDPEIRAAALRVRNTVQPDDATLQSARHDPSPLVRSTALVAALAHEENVNRTQELEEYLSSSSTEVHVALAQAIERQASPVFDGALLRLADMKEPAVKRHVAHAMALSRNPLFLPKLLGMLGPRATREDARKTFVAYGEPALRFLEECLVDPTIPKRIRRQLPRTISRFEPAEAASVLLKYVGSHPDGTVRFRILRGLGRITADNPGMSLDPTPIQDAIQRTMDTLLDLVGWRTALARGTAAEPKRETASKEVLIASLRDKERHALERLFRLLGLTIRTENMRVIHRGVTSQSPKDRAGSRELLENLVEPPLREPLLAMVDDLPDEQRLARAGRKDAAHSLDYEEALRALVHGTSETLSILAAYHASELGIHMGRKA